MSKAFEEAFQLSQQDPLPNDVLDKLNELEKHIDETEKEDFSWIYEGVYLTLNDMRGT